MVSLHDYSGREQSYVKHVFLENYLEALIHKTASVYSHIVYVDGFAGPWQSANEKFEDTSFGIALAALRRAKASWKEKGRNVQMSAFLVERDTSAYVRLADVPSRYPDIAVRTYNADFLAVFRTILNDIPKEAFAFFLIDPKGWRIPLRTLGPLLARSRSEVVFNFMFDFINRAVSIDDPNIVAALDALIPFGDWRKKLAEIERSGVATPEQRKSVLVDAFGQSLKQLGKYSYVVETTVLRTLKNRSLYCLFYATRHAKGIEVFRDSQIKALRAQSETRAATQLKHTAASSGQGEIFESLLEMAPDSLDALLQEELTRVPQLLLELAPKAPDFILYEELRAQVLMRLVVRSPDVNRIAAQLHRENHLFFPGWEKGKRVPQPRYQAQRA